MQSFYYMHIKCFDNENLDFVQYKQCQIVIIILQATICWMMLPVMELRLILPNVLPTLLVNIIVEQTNIYIYHVVSKDNSNFRLCNVIPLLCSLFMFGVHIRLLSISECRNANTSMYTTILYGAEVFHDQLAKHRTDN